MTPTELIAAFESLAEAPDGVARLRELILQLAVRGRLVEQHHGDGSASDLVQRVLAEAKGRKIRVEIIHESRKPFDAPASWGWVYLGDAMDLFNGRAFKPADWRSEGLRIVRIQNLNDPGAAYNYCDPAIDRRFCIDSGCLLLSWSGTPGTSFGAFVWQGGLAALNQHIFRCEPRADAFTIHFLRLAINSRLNEMIALAHGGVGLRHITKGKLEGLWLPVPPLAEQHRIVARVD
ncbi:MAG: restriction endonuclease subunit S, partial [Rhodospirillales bacterium]